MLQHYRIPSVMRLAFHLLGEQRVIYGANEDIEDILNKTTNASSMFTGWFECNKNHDLAKTLTYAEFPTKFDLNEEQLKNLALLEIESFLISNNSSLRRYQQIPFPDMETISRATNPLMVEELSYDTETMNNEFNNLWSLFVYGYGGTGKTYLWKTLSASIRSKGEVVLNVASRGIASLLLEGGRTAHSRFLIPINLTKDSICPVKVNTDVYELLKKTSLIIWDEAPMIHKHAFEALDRTLNDVMNGDSGNTSEAVFGGKVVVFCGDFRQILPVVTNDVENIREFADWLLDIGQGNVGGLNDGQSVIEIPDDLLLLNSVDPMGDIISFVYPNILDRFNELTYFQDCALLAPLNEVVQEINERMLAIFPGEQSKDFDPQLYSPDLLNGLKMSGMPNHRLVIKVGVPIMLSRNINHKKGLCNGTRLQVVSLGRRVIEAKVVSGTNIGYQTLISRVSLTPTDKKLPFRLKRRQFPISVCFAMTINKSQGQSLSRVGLYLKDPLFSHGQLYVALSRVKSRDGIKLVILDKESKLTNKTTNVV
ncbi:uncharacterized protein LOC143575300 [Bidens hawaiensis]|uniref:uncharacterized protein LOC143575300 n=1 Tax=Bidens hawaiensis TaxID=980011 RepID=UPI00404B8F0F